MRALEVIVTFFSSLGCGVCAVVREQNAKNFHPVDLGAEREQEMWRRFSEDTELIVSSSKVRPEVVVAVVWGLWLGLINLIEISILVALGGRYGMWFRKKGSRWA